MSRIFWRIFCILACISATLTSTVRAAESADDQYFERVIEKVRREQEALKKEEIRRAEELKKEEEWRAEERRIRKEIETTNSRIKQKWTAEGAPTFFPTERNSQKGTDMVILPLRCAKGLDIEWDDTYRSFIGGLEPGSKIKAFSQNGRITYGSLGPPECFPGACTWHYVALPVIIDEPLENMVAISRPSSISTTDVKLVQAATCEEIPSEVKHPYGSETEELPTICYDLSLENAEKKIFGQIISYGWIQLNGWHIYQHFFRRVTTTKTDKIKYGNMEKLDYTTSQQFPIFEFVKNGGPASLLWHQRLGLGPVSAFSLEESSFDSNGHLKWLSRFTVGGQPCD